MNRIDMIKANRFQVRAKAFILFILSIPVNFVFQVLQRLDINLELN